jgi:hypothetical protein
LGLYFIDDPAYLKIIIDSGDNPVVGYNGRRKSHSALVVMQKLAKNV